MSKKNKKKAKINMTSNMKFILVSGIAALIILLIAVYSMMGKYNGLGPELAAEICPYNTDNYSSVNGEIFYNDSRYESKTIIDVSVFQKSVDFERVKEDGVDGVMIRLGYRGAESGELSLDEKYKENVKKAGDAGLLKGVYFFSQAVTPEEAIEEARFVVRNIRGEGIKLPVAFDMEPVAGADRIKGLSRKEKTEIADAFCQVIKRNGYEPVIYGNPTWLNNHIDLDYLTDYGIWLAHYAYYTDFNKKYLIWQYTDSGQVNGIDGYVDLNIYLTERDD